MIEIVKLKKEHINDVYEIERACFHNPWSIENLSAQLDCDTSHFLVALADGAVAGYMGLQIFSGEGYVTNVAVLPEYRRRGIAKMLIDEQMKNDMQFISLEVRESNTAAINLYTGAGFECMGIRPKFYDNPTEDAVIMTRFFNEGK